MRRLQSLIWIVIFMDVVCVFGQIGINTPLPDPSAALEVAASNQGFLPPRVKLLGKNDAYTIKQPAIGLLIYNTESAGLLNNNVQPGYYYWNGSNWERLTNSLSSVWALTGNNSTNPKINYLGTSDDNDLVFRRNSSLSGLLSLENTSFGVNSLSNMGSAANYNTAIGVNALRKLDQGTQNTAIGYGALEQNNYYSNVAIGAFALQNTIQAFGNVGVGNHTMRNNSRGTGNSSLGNAALSDLKAGDWNIGIGQYAGSNLISGSHNIFIGASTNAPIINGSNQLNIGNSIFGVNINAGTSTAATIGINTNKPNVSAVLDLSARNKGFLPPRVELKGVSDIETILNPATGLLVYNTVNAGVLANGVQPGFYYYNGSNWERLLNSIPSVWGIAGNDNVDSKINYIGSNNDSDLVFKRNKKIIGFLSDSNISFGLDALSSIESGRLNSSFGISSLLKNKTGSSNTAIGSYTLVNNLTSFNTAVGSNSLSNVTSGDANTAIGNASSQNLRSGRMNTSMGHNAFYNSNSGSYNTMIGSYAGYNSMYGNYNTALGNQAFNANEQGSYNLALGNSSLIDFKPISPETGNNNVAVGSNAAKNLTSGSNNLFLGANTLALDSSGSNQLNIGNSIFGVNVNAGTSTEASIGINTKAPSSSAVLELSSKNKGFLPPRVQLKGIKDLETIVNPSQGLLVYNTASLDNKDDSIWPGYYYFESGSWISLKTASSNSWSLNGNLGTKSDANFIGTLDDTDLVFKRNNKNVAVFNKSNLFIGELSGKDITNGYQNTAIGNGSLSSITVGQYNTAVGDSALKSNVSGSANTSIGSMSLGLNTLGNSNTSLGHNSMYSNTSGYDNTAVGAYSLQSNITGRENIAIGVNSLSKNNSGNNNLGIGSRSLEQNQTGISNVAIGSYSNNRNVAGSNNVALGLSSLYENQGDYNTAIGDSSLRFLKDKESKDNLALGHLAGNDLRYGSSNIFIGANTKAVEPSGSNQLNIGNSIFGVNVNAGASTEASIGINTKTPSSSAVLELSSKNKGFLPPRVELKGIKDLETILNPVQGLLVYNTASTDNTEEAVLPGYYYYNGTSWVLLGNTDNLWSTKGNYGTDSKTSFIGTNDNQDLVFKRNTIKAGLISDSNTYNTSFGLNTYQGTPQGSFIGRWNTAIGYGSLYGEQGKISGHDNTGVGANSLNSNSTGKNNTAVGSEALRANKIGNDNTSVGFRSMASNTTGNNNIALGVSALVSNSTGNDNTAIGYLALNQNISGSNNTAIGNESGVEFGGLYNTTSIGSKAKVFKSNSIRFGDSNITDIYGQVPFSYVSDKRYIDNVSSLNLGLEFINQLKPVEYTRTNNNSKTKEWGIIAQDLSEVLKDLNYTNAGVIDTDKSNDQTMLLRYSDLLAPMIKAIQELTQENKELKQRLDVLENL